MKNDKLSVLSMNFAVEVYHLSKELKSKNEYCIADQIFRSAASIGANIREAQYASSKADFINKLHISLKEANETGFWLELLLNTDCITQNDYENLEAQCRELRVLLIHSLNTAKRSE